MRKRKFYSMILLALVSLLCLACAVFFTACGNNEMPDDGHNTEQGGENPDDDEPGTDPDDDKDIAVTAVSLNKTSLTLEVGESYTLVVNVSPSNATDKSITWSSTNSSVAAISGGKVTAKSEGTTTITAEAYNGKTATCTVTVNEPASEVIEVTSVSLNKTSLTLEIGESETLTATVLPSNATDKSVTWTSFAQSIATVANGKVTAIGSGTAIITATTSNGKTATCTVTVNEPASEVIEVTSVSLNKTSLTLEIGESETLTATVLPSNATDKTISWTSSDLSVATVTNGTVTAIGSGTATIAATTSNGKTATCTVMVNDPYADFSFTLSGNGYVLAGYSGTDTEVTVPAEYNGKTVTAIGSRAFYDCSFITKIILPDSLKEIGDVAFGYCTSLQTVEIPACTRILNSVFLGCTSLREVTLPDGVVTIGSNLFSNCNSLQKVTILSGSVLRYTFADCANLKEIVIGENVTSVAQGAFKDCTSLQYLTLPRVDENTSFNEYYFDLESQTYTLSGTGADNLYPAETRSYTVNIGGVNRVFALPVTGTDWYYSRSSTTVDGITYQYSGKPITVSSWESMYEATVSVSWRRPKTWTAEFYIPQDSSLTKLTVTDQLISIYDEVFDGCGCEIDIVQKFPVESVSVIGETELYLDEFSLDDYILRVKHTDGWIEDLPLAEHLTEADKQELQQSGAHSLTVSYGGQSCEFNIVLNLHIFDTAVLEDMTFAADGSAKYLQVTGIPEDTEIIWKNNGQTEVGEYTVTATLKKPYYENMTLTAHLYIRQAQYNITYVLGIEEAENSNPATYTFGEELTLSSPASDAWGFLGWYADADFTEKVTAISADEYGDKTFYAKWQSIFEYINGEITGFTEYGRSQYDGGKLTSISIPSEIGGQKIISVGDSAFFGCSRLTSVTIPNSVTRIRSYAFRYCSGLKEMHISDLAAWCAIDFADSSSNPLYYANNLYLNDELITDLIIPDSVTSIGSSAFSGCSGLTSVTIGNGVTSIGSYAFKNCSGLTIVTIPDSVTSIDGGAFSGCSGLTSVTIPDSVTSIGSYAFENCSGLKEVHISDLATWCAIDFADSFSNPLYYAHNLYLNDLLITDLIIPDDVTSIGNSAFYNCSSLTSVAIPDSVTSIDGGAFSGCSGLTSITLPFIGGSASATSASHATLFGYIFGTRSYAGGTATQQYYDFGSYKTYYIPTSLKSVIITCGNIFYGAFYNCSNLTSVEIPDSVTSIRDYAFTGCSGLTSVTIGNGVTSIGDFAFEGCRGLTSITIPDSVTSIGDGAFRYCYGLTNVEIPNSVKSIGESAFRDCSGLTNVEIPNSVTNIGNYAFSGCSSLTSVAIPDSVTSIDGGAFYGCSGLTNVEIPDSVTSVGSSAFYGCSGLTNVTIGDGVTSIGDSAFRGCSGLTSVTIGNSVTSIGSYVFSGCSGLTSVTIGNSVTSIGSYVFSGCSGLASIKIPDSVKSIGERAFYNCSGLTSVTIGNSVTSIGTNAFYNCSGLTSITIPESVMSIGEYAFYYCSGLTSVEIPNSVTNIGNYAFYNCSGLTSVTIGDGVTSIGGAAFSDCSGLTNVTIGDGVTSIGDSAFRGCSSLTSVTIPDGVTSIGDFAFNGCSGLTSVTIGNNVTSIGSSAFYNCSGLTNITIPDSVTSIGWATFEDCNSLTSVIFENPNGWWYSYSSTATSGTSIASSDLSDPATAATYLKSTYCNYYWKRS